MQVICPAKIFWGKERVQKPEVPPWVCPWDEAYLGLNVVCKLIRVSQGAVFKSHDILWKVKSKYSVADRFLKIHEKDTLDNIVIKVPWELWLVLYSSSIWCQKRVKSIPLQLTFQISGNLLLQLTYLWHTYDWLIFNTTISLVIVLNRYLLYNVPFKQRYNPENSIHSMTYFSLELKKRKPFPLMLNY